MFPLVDDVVTCKNDFLNVPSLNLCLILKRGNVLLLDFIVQLRTFSVSPACCSAEDSKRMVVFEINQIATNTPLTLLLVKILAYCNCT